LAVTPLCIEAGCARRNHVFPKNRSKIFLPQGLDERTQLNLLGKFDFARTRILRLESLVSAPMSTKIEPILPDGRIGFEAGQTVDAADIGHASTARPRKVFAPYRSRPARIITDRT